MRVSLLERHVRCLTTVAIGSIIERSDIKSSLGPFKIMPDYRIIYPEVVIKALSNLYDEYNKVFVPLVEMNREWDTDYRYCQLAQLPINWCVQIDMVGLPDTFLKEVSGMSEQEVREILRKKIFEIENSIAMYQLLEEMFSQNGEDSFFKINFRAVMDDLRRRFGMPIAILAVTKQKYRAMLVAEFGRRPNEELTNKEVKGFSGFDAFFSPWSFSKYLTTNGGRCEYLLYVRSSDPVEKLRKPDFVVKHPLLSNKDMRRVIKAHTLTLNIDAPEMEYTKRINDTKEYMAPMGMAFQVTAEDDFFSPEFETYLKEQGIDHETMTEVMLRCKPAKCTYGCYGHLRGVLSDALFLEQIERNLRLRGDYVVQPEMTTPLIQNAVDHQVYTFIDRNFFGIVNGCPKFLGGVRNLMPMNTMEAREGRIHGNSSAVYAEIVG